MHITTIYNDALYQRIIKIYFYCDFNAVNRKEYLKI